MNAEKTNFKTSFGQLYIPKDDKPLRKIIKNFQEEFDEFSRYADITITRETKPFVIAGCENQQKIALGNHTLKIMLSPLKQNENLITSSCTVCVKDKKTAPTIILNTIRKLFRFLF